MLLCKMAAKILAIVRSNPVLRITPATLSIQWNKLSSDTSKSQSSESKDEVTHTGQAWENDDYRMSRFEYQPKQVNPNWAINLIAKVPPKPVDAHVACCDGGGGPLGHPKVYINLDQPGNHTCGYCGLRFYQDHHH
ncbi:PREDICTED: probable NADH dehydrogenase [ubiquinone] iron-sulfur protein 6, mitochondrial [Priapulus caudatus]|uniref:NADH dehydrogenase [ubiquinone] iron-sulfur protein 6, mitochondrial n=1 Tax=Priapulus caudatus TaxID=37621 RepID=A0ABM1EJ84_PRICU|nr:PREDICTED: probable NADH dehydrogenase [ubiquinone] iron-sulfur protein 6, mitochondrial [Priapulus caudatus]